MDSEWNPFPIVQLYHLQVATSLYSLLLQVANFTMRLRVIPFVFAGTAVTFCNTYAYASPVKSPVSDLDNPGLRQREATWCGGYSKLTCSIDCKLEGYDTYTCTEEYVQFQFQILQLEVHINSIPYADIQIAVTVIGKLTVGLFRITSG